MQLQKLVQTAMGICMRCSQLRWGQELGENYQERLLGMGIYALNFKGQL